MRSRGEKGQGGTEGGEVIVNKTNQWRRKGTRRKRERKQMKK